MNEIIQFFTDYGDYILIFCCGALLGLWAGLDKADRMLKEAEEEAIQAAQHAREFLRKQEDEDDV